MKKQEASALVERLAARWPCLDIQILAVRDDGYALALTLPGRYNYRQIRLARESEFEGILGLCSVLLDDVVPEAGVAILPASPPVLRAVLTPADIQAIRASYGPYTPGHVGKRSLRGNPKPSIDRLAFHYHVGKKRIMAILRDDEVEQRIANND